MNFDSYSLKELRDQVTRLSTLKSENRISNPEAEFLNLVEQALVQRLSEAVEAYGDILRPAHRELLRKLRSVYIRYRSDMFSNISYISAYFGVCIYSNFQEPEFGYLKSYFPTIKLPLVVTDGDIEDYSNETYHDISLRNSIHNFINDYTHVSRGRPEEYLKKIWFPAVLSLVNSLTIKHDVTDLILIPEFNLKNMKTVGDLRYLDFVVADGRDGLPILVVEIAANAVEDGCHHKDLLKMILSMSHILMCLVQRAAVHCPDEDFSKFRVFGLLIGGSVFECCVGSIVKNSKGQINFIFYSDDSHWKFDLFHFYKENNVESQVMCSGDDIEVGQFVDDSIGPFNFEPTQSLVDVDLYLEGGNNEMILENSFLISENLIIPPFKSEIALWKFISVVVKYYSNLSSCLKECIQKIPDNFSETLSIYNFPPELSSIGPSPSRHSGKINKSSPPCENVEIILETREQNEIYAYLDDISFQTLPDVLVYVPELKTVELRFHKYFLYDFIEDENERIDTIKEMVSKKYLALTNAKLIMDLLLAAYKIHSLGYVCGSFEISNIAFNGMFFQLNTLHNITKESRSSDINPSELESFNPAFHIETGPKKLSKRDDLYSIFRCAQLGLIGYFGSVLWEDHKIPLFKKFVELTLNRMCKWQDCPDLDVTTILRYVIPIYDEMIQKLIVPKMNHLIATQTLARRVLNEILSAKPAEGSLSYSTESVSKTEITLNPKCQPESKP